MIIQVGIGEVIPFPASRILGRIAFQAVIHQYFFPGVGAVGEKKIAFLGRSIGEGLYDGGIPGPGKQRMGGQKPKDCAQGKDKQDS